MSFDDYLKKDQQAYEAARTAARVAEQKAKEQERKAQRIHNALGDYSTMSYLIYNVPREMSSLINEIRPHLVYDTPFNLVQVDDELYGYSINVRNRRTPMGIIIEFPASPVYSKTKTTGYSVGEYPKMVILDNGYIGFHYFSHDSELDIDHDFPASWNYFKPDWNAIDTNVFYSTVSRAIMQAKETMEKNPPKKWGLFW